MARPLRINAPGEFFHVLARGNSRLPIFEDDRDRTAFLALLAEIVDRFEVRCHVYCLMGNHYHLLLQPMRLQLSMAIRQLNGVYAQRFNRRHRRSGHLFEGRHKCLLVDHQTYLMELARYIVLNPVRARLVDDPEAWRWSSYRATAGLESPPRFLSVDFIRRAAGGRDGAPGAADFRSLVQLPLDPSMLERESLLGNLITKTVAVGEPAFLEECARRAQPSREDTEIPVEHRRVGRPSLVQLFADAGGGDRKARIRSAVLEHGYSQAEVARALGLGRMTVSRVVRSSLVAG